MRVAAALLIICVSACGISPAPEQAWQVRDDWLRPQAELDAQAIMAGMDLAGIRAALLAHTSR
jgi:hypothetical protein